MKTYMGVSDNGFTLPGILNNDTIKKHLTANDLAFIEKQYKMPSDSIWLPAELKDFTLIDSTGINTIGKHSMKRKRMGNNYSYAFSTPLFSADGHYAVVKEHFYCGFMCADWCTTLYRRSDDKKKWIKVYQWLCISA